MADDIRVLPVNEASDDWLTIQTNQILTSRRERSREDAAELRLDPLADVGDLLLDDNLFDQMYT